MRRWLFLSAWVVLAALTGAACSKNDGDASAEGNNGPNAAPASNSTAVDSDPQGAANTGLGMHSEPEDTLRKPPIEPGVEVHTPPPTTSPATDSGNATATTDDAEREIAPSLFRSLGRALGKGVNDAITETGEAPQP